MKILDFVLNLFFKKNNVTSNKEVANESCKKNNNSVLSDEELYRNNSFNFFQQLDKNIINQDIIELYGEGTLITPNGRSRYGHVKIKLSLSTKNKSEIIWNISGEEIPNNYRTSIIESAKRFIVFFECHRKDLKKVTIEIIGGSSHPTDSDFLAFELAMRNAIYNSFDKRLHQPNLNRLFNKKIKEPMKWVNYKKKK
ncbi:hypothetical protein OD917_04965 [Flavobacterium sp. SH_e]|uniref:hypothetical protein n=1 Tax=Flavobacterium sp. SH_e TaxID=2983767 RepID=UPI0021E484C7|nr:hypothetical protein [Flavobacterium sp. SH_e]MCV2484263.1 hypothetical protein [Flavobacterium sp. SH_e]